MWTRSPTSAWADDPAQGGAQHEPERRARDRVGGVVHAYVDPAEGNRGGQPVPERCRPEVVVGEEDRGGERGGDAADVAPLLQGTFRNPFDKTTGANLAWP